MITSLSVDLKVCSLVLSSSSVGHGLGLAKNGVGKIGRQLLSIFRSFNFSHSTFVTLINYVSTVWDYFSALTLLVGWQEEHPACKKLIGGVLAWLSVWSEV